MRGRLPSPRMADTTLSYVNAPDITIDEAFVGLSGAVTIAGAAVVLSGAVSFALGSASGTVVSRTVSSGGAYTAGQTIRITTTSANTAATFGTVSLAGTRA